MFINPDLPTRSLNHRNSGAGSRHRIRRAPGHAGFSLFEVTLALFILALLAGSIYGVIRGTVQMAASMDEARARQQQLDGLMELCRKSFRMLPAKASLEGRIRQVDGKILPEVLIRQAPELLAWDQVRDFETMNVIGLRPQLGGLFSLSLLRVSEAEILGKDPVSAAQPDAWLPLISDLSKVEWRFYDPRAGAWLDTLPRGSARPTAVELKLWLPEEENPVTAVFWVVPLLNQVTVPLEPEPTP
ncbi:MAG: prepilin-type N-terminal cleavage/methylation domain-containing protein [Blastochloris sp.]|nr:prepilin-type N-terminal cleavage/methylation domain-containing protein [Blastochloris sp.]